MVEMSQKRDQVKHLIDVVQSKLKSRPVGVSAMTKKNTRSLHLRQRTFLSSGRLALHCPVGRQAVSVARSKRFLRQRTFEQFTIRTVHKAAVSVITIGDDVARRARIIACRAG